MVIPSSRSWMSTVFAWRGTALQRIWLRLLITLAIAVAVSVMDLYLEIFHSDLTLTPYTLIGLALSIFLGFRNNTSYDRFWEGRKLWGGLVNNSRTLTRQALTLVDDGGDDTRRELVHRVIAYVHCLRLHLRDDRDHRELAAWLPAADFEQLDREWNRPAYLLQRLGDRFRELYDAGRIHALHLSQLDATLSELTNIQGACERIKSTPIPYSYTVLIHRIVAVYCFTLPFGVVRAVGFYTPVVVLLISYAFFGLDAVGEQIEDPFGTDPNDLPLNQLCITIERDLRQRLGDTELPELLTGEIVT